MWYQVAADFLMVFHLLFIVFVIFGGILVTRWLWLAILHVPAVTWGVLVEINNWVCVLTPWENQLRKLAGQEGYPGGFVEHYIAPVIYPGGLTPGMQFTMGVSLLTINIFVYGYILYRVKVRSSG